MKACKKYQKEWTAFLSGELSANRMEDMAAHLQNCRSCQQELERTRNLVAMTESFKDELKQVMDTIDWEALPATIASKVWKKQEAGASARPLSGRWLWKWQPLAVGMFLGLLLGGILTLIVFKPQKPGWFTARQEPGISVPADLMERVDVAMARRDAIDYLERSQYLLLDLLQREQSSASVMFQRERIQKLLTEKKYLNNQLDDWRLMKARAICDQIELLFLELSQLSPELTAAELERVRKMVEEKQLLLKINLVKKELQQSEV